jgi:hypothetical protein
MSTMIYQYTWDLPYEVKFTEKGLNNTEDDVRNDLKQGIAKATLEKLTEKLASIGKWIKVDSLTVDITSFYRQFQYGYPPSPPITIAKGKAITVFSTDATPDQEFSPQGWEEALGFIVGSIIAIIMAHQVLFFALLIIIALTFLASRLTAYNEAGGVTGTLFGAGSAGNPLAQIGTFIIVILIILALAGLLPTVMLWLTGRKKAKGKKGKSE